MSGRHSMFAVVAALSLVWFGTAAAETTNEIAYKEPSVFHRPATDSPTRQLAYADFLEKQGCARKALRAYQALVHTWHDSPEAARAQWACGRVEEERGNYTQAFYEYQYLIDHFHAAGPYDEILKRQFAIANHMMSTKSGRFLFYGGSVSAEDARPLFERIVQNAPTWEKAAEIQLCVGLAYEEAEEYASAIRAYDVLERRYPRHALAVDAAFRRARCHYKLAQISPRDKAAWRNAQRALAAFLGKHGDDKRAAEVRGYLDEVKEHLADIYYAVAVYYDRVEKRPLSALLAYQDFLRNHKLSRHEDAARERVDILREKTAAARKGDNK